jgi:hypothetical protein
MTPENFCYWFQGWLELERPETITPEQVQEIKNHLDLVFNKVTPDMRLYKSSDTALEYKITSDYPVVRYATGIDSSVLELLKKNTIVNTNHRLVLEQFDHAHVDINNKFTSKENCYYCHPELKTQPSAEGYGGGIANDNSLLKFMGGPGLSC